MLRVKTRLAVSRVDGIGLFADEHISKGTTTWKYDRQLDSSWSLDLLEQLPPFLQEQLMKYLFWDDAQSTYVLCSDDQRFINHSSRPNILSSPYEDIALEDIPEGSELTCDYRGFEPEWFERRSVDASTFKS